MPSYSLLIFLMTSTGIAGQLASCGRHFAENPLERLLGGADGFAMPESRLVGGVNTAPHAWPWAVQMTFKGKHRCGGALIDARFVITAAHCFAHSKEPTEYMLYLGGHGSLSGTPHRMVNISQHPLYNIVWPSAYDVAIVKIDPPAVFSPTVQQICLPLAPPLNNKMCVVAGWGILDESGTRAEALNEIHVPIVPLAVCNNIQHYGGRIYGASMMCAGYSQGRVDSCLGDSGGPLMCDSAGRWELHGVVSWGIGCGRPGHPGVYTRILPAFGWIHTQMFLLK